MPPTGGTAGASAGMGGSSGIEAPSGGGGGFANAGGGGVCSGCAGAAGASGMMAAGVGGGMGGSSGTAAGGAGGAMTSDDAGVVTAPELVCATGREVVEVEVIDADAAMPVCVLTLPESARMHAPADLSLAITTNMSGTTDTLRIAQADAWRMCDLPDGSGAYYPLTLGTPMMIELCPEVCELARDASALIELVYGCTADFSSEMP